MYGDPFYYADIEREDKSVHVKEPGNFGFEDKCFIDWTNPPDTLIRVFVAPLADKQNYAYSYFQVTAVLPETDRRMAFKPAGLIETVCSESLGENSQFSSFVKATIDLSKFVPPPDKSNPVQYRYYVRAVHVYADYDRPWIAHNIYYAQAGAVQFYDSRPYDLTHPGADNPQDAATYGGGLTSEWKAWASPYGDLSLELDPKIDAQGRSPLPECYSRGVQ